MPVWSDDSRDVKEIVLWFGPAKPELYQAVIAECFHITDYSKRDCWVADR